jgi:polysaccharide pyruvyl transferase WcaK-like protein
MFKLAVNGDRVAKEFVIWGGYGGHNLGDEAILWALSRQLRRLEPTAKQYVLVRGAVTDEVRAQYEAWQIEAVAGSISTFLPVLRKARLIVGGGQMVDDTSLGWPVGWSSLFLLINWIFGKKPLVTCIGAESLNRTLPRLLVKYVYSRARLCTCRDVESTEVLKRAGVNESKLLTTRDVVFSLDRSLLPQWKITESNAHPKVAILIAYDPKRIRETTARSTQLIDALLNVGIAVQLVAHDLRAEYDLYALAEIQKKYAGHPGVTTAEAQTVGDVLTIYSQTDAVISGRMHPLILASLAGTLPIAFGGKAKVQSLLAMSGIPALSSGTPEEQAAQVQELIVQKTQILPKIAAVVADFRANVEGSMAKALAL